jgi:hypothetical protein
MNSITKPKRKGRGKIKGGRFEREICKRLSLWVSKGKRDDLFWRSAMSGGRATLQLRKGVVNKSQSGDMTAIAPEGYALCEECLFEYKFYTNLNIAEGLIKGTGELRKFWRETTKAAKHYGKKPVLIAKQNHMPILVIVRLGAGLFDTTATPIMTSHSWRADVFLFSSLDEGTPKPKRVLLDKV